MGAALNGCLARFPPTPADGNPKLPTSSRSTLPWPVRPFNLLADIRDFGQDFLALGLVADE
jgi:hypothetical protein